MQLCKSLWLYNTIGTMQKIIIVRLIIIKVEQIDKMTQHVALVRRYFNLSRWSLSYVTAATSWPSGAITETYCSFVQTSQGTNMCGSPHLWFILKLPFKCEFQRWGNKFHQATSAICPAQHTVQNPSVLNKYCWKRNKSNTDAEFDFTKDANIYLITTFLSFSQLANYAVYQTSKI